MRRIVLAVLFLVVAGLAFLFVPRGPEPNAPQFLPGPSVQAIRAHALASYIESDGTKRFSIPRFYNKSVIYVRSNALWRIALNGSNNTRLFPPLD